MRKLQRLEGPRIKLDEQIQRQSVRVIVVVSVTNRIRKCVIGELSSASSLRSGREGRRQTDPKVNILPAKINKIFSERGLVGVLRKGWADY